MYLVLSSATCTLDLGHTEPNFLLFRTPSHDPHPLSPCSFPQIVMAIANADIANASLKERWTFATPTPLVARKMAALLQVYIILGMSNYSKIVCSYKINIHYLWGTYISIGCILIMHGSSGIV